MAVNDILKKNEIYPITIQDFDHIGNGIGRVNGCVVFVPHTAIGDYFLVRIVKVLKNYAYGIIEDMLKPSPLRIKPLCTCMGKCGGCQLAHITYQAELDFKEKHIGDCLKKQGIQTYQMPIIGAAKIERYRNKAQYPLAYMDGKAVCGFYAKRSHRVIPTDDCFLQPDIFSDIVKSVLRFINHYHISIYNEESKTGLLRSIFLRRAETTGQIMLCLVATSFKIPYIDKLTKQIQKKFPSVVSIVVNKNSSDTNVVLGKTSRVMAGTSYIFDNLAGIRVKISPLSFYQIHHEQAEKLFAVVRDFASISPNSLLLELYCGIGVIGLSLSDIFDQLIGVEIVEQAVENAKENAVDNHIVNARFICMDAAEAANMFFDKGIKPDTILLDPPRKGCDQQTLSTIVAMHPQHIIMVSCNPATAARDLAFLLDKGYCVQRVQPVDLFPRTVHTECVALLSYNGYTD